MVFIWAPEGARLAASVAVTAEIAADVQPPALHPGGPVVDEAVAALAPNGHENGHDTLAIDGAEFDLHQMLQALQAVRARDFSPRLPRDGTGLAVQISDTLNDIVAAK